MHVFLVLGTARGAAGRAFPAMLRARARKSRRCQFSVIFTGAADARKGSVGRSPFFQPRGSLFLCGSSSVPKVPAVQGAMEGFYCITELLFGRYISYIPHSPPNLSHTSLPLPLLTHTGAPTHALDLMEQHSAQAAGCVRQCRCARCCTREAGARQA